MIRCICRFNSCELRCVGKCKVRGDRGHSIWSQIFQATRVSISPHLALFTILTNNDWGSLLSHEHTSPMKAMEQLCISPLKGIMH